MSEYEYHSGALGCASSYLLPILTKAVEAVPRGGVVMDLGCGNGSMLAQFQDRELALFGLDVSTSGIAAARKAYPALHVEVADLCGDLSNHPLAGKCDLVITTEVVEHVFQPRILAKNCFCLLKPGGKIAISTPYHGYAKNVALALLGRMDAHFTALWDHGHIKFWSRKTLTELLREAEFREFSFHGTGRYPYFWKSMVILATR